MSFLRRSMTGVSVNNSDEAELGAREKQNILNASKAARPSTPAPAMQRTDNRQIIAPSWHRGDRRALANHPASAFLSRGWITGMSEGANLQPSMFSPTLTLLEHWLPWAMVCVLSVGQLTLQLASMARCRASPFQPKR